jgi:hypothetical protein
MLRLSCTAQDLSKQTDSDTRFTRYRGDGWQIVLPGQNWVLRACLTIIADLRASDAGIDTRISVGIGRVESLGTANLSDATGPAFFVSGTHLDAMPRHRRLFIAGGAESDKTWQAAIFDLVEWQSGKWTPPQAQAVAMALRLDWNTQQDLADRLGISRQAMQSRLAGAGFSALTNALAQFENQKDIAIS